MSDTVREIDKLNTHLTYLKKLVGHRLLINHPTSGARAPNRKKYVRPKHIKLSDGLGGILLLEKYHYIIISNLPMEWRAATLLTGIFVRVRTAA